MGEGERGGEMAGEGQEEFDFALGLLPVGFSEETTNSWNRLEMNTTWRVADNQYEIRT